MDTNELRTLNLLAALDKGRDISQRELSQTLEISLGLVNASLKNLCGKGLLKKASSTSKRANYVMTPKGRAEKNKLSYQRIRQSLQFYINTRKWLEELFALFSEQGAKRIVFYGAGEIAEVAYLALINTDIRLMGIVDSGRQGERYLNSRIMGHDRLQSLAFDKLLITKLLDEKQQLRISRLSQAWPQKLAYIFPALQNQ